MIKLEFQIDQANYLVGLLGKLPYEQSAGMIHFIQEQARAQLPDEENQESE